MSTNRTGLYQTDRCGSPPLAPRADAWATGGSGPAVRGGESAITHAICNSWSFVSCGARTVVPAAAVGLGRAKSSSKDSGRGCNAVVGDVYGFRKGAVGQLSHPVRVATALGGRMPTLLVMLLLLCSCLVVDSRRKYHESAKSAPSVSAGLPSPQLDCGTVLTRRHDAIRGHYAPLQSGRDTACTAGGQDLNPWRVSSDLRP